MFTYYKSDSAEYLLPSKQVWYWYGSATADANPGDSNAPVGGTDIASWPSPQSPSHILYQPVGTATFTPIVGSNEATAVGSAAIATAQNTVAIGANATANQINAVALGQAAAATSDHTCAFGNNSAASATFAQAFGYGSIASAASGVAIGANAKASGVEATAIGKKLIGGGRRFDRNRRHRVGRRPRRHGDRFRASANFTNATAIGFEAAAISNNAIALGNGAVSHIYAAVSSITAISDRRRKKDIRDVDLGLDFVARLRPVVPFPKWRRDATLWLHRPGSGANLATPALRPGPKRRRGPL